MDETKIAVLLMAYGDAREDAARRRDHGLGADGLVVQRTFAAALAALRTAPDDECEEEPIAVSYPRRSFKVTGRVVVPDAVRALVETWRRPEHSDVVVNGTRRRCADELEAALRTAPPVRTYEDGVRDALAKVAHVQRDAQEGDPAAPWLECVAALIGALSAAPPVELREPSVPVMVERMRRSLEHLADHLANEFATQWVAQDIGAILDGTEEDHPHDEQAVEPSVPVSVLRAVLTQPHAAGVSWFAREGSNTERAMARAILETLALCDAAEQDTERETRTPGGDRE